MTFNDLVAVNAVYKKVIESAKRIAPHDIPILLEGEIGCGKQALAQAIHFASPRSKKEFIVLDCSSHSELSLEAELFGYLRGSFAGAIHEKKGLLELADGGTVYLDHLSKLSIPMQGKLFKVLSEGRFHKLGGVAEVRVDIRFIAGSEADLKQLMEKGKFRKDLFYLLNATRLTIPPLRERRDYMIALVHSFLDSIASRNRSQPIKVTDEGMRILTSYSWPGNVSELEREIERAVLLAGTGNRIGKSELSSEVRRGKKWNPKDKTSASTGTLKDQKKRLVASLEENAIREALRESKGNRTRAAQLLSISRQELIRKISRYKVKS